MIKLGKGESHLENWTNLTSINIDNVPKELVIEISKEIGQMILDKGLQFEYGGIGLGGTDKITGIVFEIE